MAIIIKKFSTKYEKKIFYFYKKTQNQRIIFFIIVDIFLYVDYIYYVNILLNEVKKM